MSSDSSEQSYEDNPWEEGGYDVAQGNQQSDMQHSDEHAQDPLIQISHAPGDEASAGDDAYDPESLVAAPALVVTNTRSPSANATAKPKTSGGFIVASDDEDDDDEPSTSAVGANAQGRPGMIPPRQVPTSAHAHLPQVNSGPVAPVNPVMTSATSGLPPNMLGALEARVKEDPRGDMDGWLALIAEYRRRERVEDIRNVYERFLKVFPQAAEIWAQYIEWELDLSNFEQAEPLYGRCLMDVPNVQLWTVYLNYIRRRNDISDGRVEARATLSQSYEFVLDNIGVDKDSGKIWHDYIQFIRSAPGTISGSSWQDQQKMDQLRKAYQRAICVPMTTVNQLWKEYDQFEMSLNKMTGRKFIQEKSPSYMSAKGAMMALDNMTKNLQLTTLPRLPPLPGFDGDAEYREQVDLWKRWLAWEKDDPLVLKDDEYELYKQRIVHCYKQALMALRFWPELWVDAAEWCFENNVVTKENRDLGLQFLKDGIAANPESVLLAFKLADRIESTHPVGEDQEAKVAKGDAVRVPYDKVLDALYDMATALKDRATVQIARMEADAKQSLVRSSVERGDYDADDAGSAAEGHQPSPRDMQIAAVKQSFVAQQDLLSKTITFVWIALARAMRRTQGKGSHNTWGLRKVFTDARHRGKLTSDVYVQVALIESMVYKDPVGAKIFEKGAKLFRDDEAFMIEYLKFLHSKDDTTNARASFETCVNRLTQNRETIAKAKPLYAYYHKFESQFGEFSQITKLEKRMAELFPEDPKLAAFSARFASDRFDPVAARIIISPIVQVKPKAAILPSIEQPPSMRSTPQPLAVQTLASPRPQFLRVTNSPKRPLMFDEADDMNRPRKLARGESPLKGAAGRRLDQQRRGQGALSRDITFLVSLLPPAETYDAVRFNPGKLVRMLQETHVPDLGEWRTRQEQGVRGGYAGGGGGGGSQPGPSSHARQTSGDFAGFGGYQGLRDSPGPGGARPLSPYDGTGRRMGAAAGGSGMYRNSPLRPGSAGSYEPPPAAVQYAPPPPGVVEGGAWQQAGAGGMYAAPQPPPGFTQYRY